MERVLVFTNTMLFVVVTILVLNNGQFVQGKTGLDEMKKVDIRFVTYNSSQSEVLTQDCDAKIEKLVEDYEANLDVLTDDIEQQSSKILEVSG